MWVWLADHDLDSGGSTQISLWSGRGILSESQGPVWLIGTGEHARSTPATGAMWPTHLTFLASEHHINYQYFLKGAANHYIGLAQTETVSAASFHTWGATRLIYLPAVLPA